MVGDLVCFAQVTRRRFLLASSNRLLVIGCVVQGSAGNFGKNLNTTFFWASPTFKFSGDKTKWDSIYNIKNAQNRRVGVFYNFATLDFKNPY